MPNFALQMVHITLHIERLLVHNDCVIVPGLGGFVTQDCSAKYVEEEELFLPPSRSVAFNQRLTMNDGLLVNDVAQHHHLDYKDAVRVVDDEVAKIRETLEQKGQYTFYGIGTLRSNNKGTYDFEPLACGVSSPDLYGLDSYYMTPLQKNSTTAKKVTIKKDEDDTLTLRLHMNMVRYAAVAAVAAVFFFVCIAPLNSAIQHQRSEAGMLHYLYTLITSSYTTDHQQAAPETHVATPMQEAQKTHVAKALNTEASEQATSTEPAATTTDATATPAAIDSEKTTHDAPAPAATAKPEPKPKEMPFAIVIASCVTETNAKGMIDSWKAKGLTAASIYDKGKYLRVFYGTYETYDSAHEALKKLRADNPAEFAEAWVYEIK